MSLPAKPALLFHNTTFFSLNPFCNLLYVNWGAAQLRGCFLPSLSSPPPFFPATVHPRQVPVSPQRLCCLSPLPPPRPAARDGVSGVGMVVKGGGRLGRGGGEREPHLTSGGPAPQIQFAREAREEIWDILRPLPAREHPAAVPLGDAVGDECLPKPAVL